MTEIGNKKRVLIFIVAYNAEKTIESVLNRIPHELGETHDVEILIIDDSSGDETFERGEAVRRSGNLPFKLHVLFNPINQGYGGNQKIGFHFAIQHGFDIVALVHGDGQYAPECLPDLVAPIAAGEADAVFGSRMMTPREALKGGMPLYKFVGNKVLTGFQNWALRSELSEFHSGYRIYSVAALEKIPFQLNTKVFHFDTEIIIQLMLAKLRIKEIPIPTYYGDEICHVDGLKYAWDVMVATLKARAQELSIFYDRKYDTEPGRGINFADQSKLSFDSAQSRVVELVAKGARVLDLNPKMTYLSKALVEKGCSVDGLGAERPDGSEHYDAFIEHDLTTDTPMPSTDAYDYILAIDVVSNHPEPEALIDRLRAAGSLSIETRLFATAGNVGFFIPRLMHMLGHFNYGKRGTLDLYTTRLFVISSFRRLFEQAGFELVEVSGIPAPYPLALGDNAWSRSILWVNKQLIRVWRSMFAYQVLVQAKPNPSLPYLLNDAYESSAARAKDSIDSEAVMEKTV